MVTFTGLSGTKWSFSEAERIGDTSGMGHVYKGVSEGGEAVAVKRIRLTSGDTEDIRRRAREPEINDRLADPSAPQPKHILVPLDRGEDGDDLFIVMPMAEKSLAKAIAGGLTEDEQTKALNETAAAMRELADRSVLSRDIKPANFLLHDGVWKVSDFGISRLLDEGTGTFTFAGWGTREYIAPEVWKGEPPTVKSDLYSFGVMMFEVLVGQRPFNGPDAAAYQKQHLLDDPNVPKSLPSTLQRTLNKLLQKDPNMRPQDPRALCEMLETHNRKLRVEASQLVNVAAAAEAHAAATGAAEKQKAAKVQKQQDDRKQAGADLATIMEEAHEVIAESLPEVKVNYDGAQWSVASQHGHLTFREFRYVPRFVGKGLNEPADQLVTAGEVTYTINTGLAGNNVTVAFTAANIVCEPDSAGRLHWKLYRFRMSGLMDPNKYSFGPWDHSHGFGENDFKDQRVYMLHSAMHVWQLEVTELTPEAIELLFAEALQERLKAAQTKPATAATSRDW